MAGVSNQRFLENKKQKGGMRWSSEEETSDEASERDGDGSACLSDTIESYDAGHLYVSSAGSSAPVFEYNASETISVSST